MYNRFNRVVTLLVDRSADCKWIGGRSNVIVDYKVRLLWNGIIKFDLITHQKLKDRFYLLMCISTFCNLSKAQCVGLHPQRVEKRFTGESSVGHTVFTLCNFLLRQYIWLFFLWWMFSERKYNWNEIMILPFLYRWECLQKANCKLYTLPCIWIVDHLLMWP